MVERLDSAQIFVVQDDTCLETAFCTPVSLARRYSALAWLIPLYSSKHKFRCPSVPADYEKKDVTRSRWGVGR